MSKGVLTVIAVLCAVILIVSPGNTTLASGVDLAGNSDEQDFQKAPKFSSTTQESILLRYKHKKGQKVGLDLDFEMSMEVMGQKIPISMKMYGDYKVQAVDSNGDTTAVFRFSRITMKSSTPMGKIEFDSDKDSATANPQLKDLKKMVGVPMPVKVSAVGKLLHVDGNPLRKALGQGANAALRQQMDQMIEKMTQGAFIQLSVDPVKAGDIYDAGKIDTSSGGMKMVFSAKYKVASVSGDKKQAILEPSGKFEIKSGTAGPQIKLNESDVDGWILFDLEKGNIIRSFAKLFMNMSVSQSGQTMTMKMTVEVKYRSKFF